MKKFKEEKGITLVALIITIVVLLILAIVSIGAVQDSGIIGHAQNAATNYTQEKVNEEHKLSGYETLINKYANNPWKEKGLTLSTIQYDKKYIGTLTSSAGDELNVEAIIESSGGGKIKYSHTSSGDTGEYVLTNESVAQGQIGGVIIITSNKIVNENAQMTVIFTDDGQSANITMRYNGTSFSGTITVIE